MSKSSANEIGSCRRSRSIPSSSRSLISRSRYFGAAFSFLLLRASFVATLGIVTWIFCKFEAATNVHLYAFGISIGVMVVSGINVLSNARKVTCPLCRASLFMSGRNLVKPGVPRILGCAKTPLAFSLLTMPQTMRCPCCAERVRLVRSS